MNKEKSIVNKEESNLEVSIKVFLKLQIIGLFLVR